MPRIVIKSLPFEIPFDVPSFLKVLGADISGELDLEMNRIVITWEFIPGNQFLFNGELSEYQKGTTHHPMVDITMMEGMPDQSVKKLVNVIANRISKDLNIDFNNVCIVINALPQGNLFLSGEFVTGTKPADS